MPSSRPINLERLYEAHAHSLYAFLLNLSRDEQDTRDILQTIYCRLASQPGLLRGVRDERAFLLRMARNLFLDSVRRAKTRNPENILEPPSLSAPSHDPDESAFRDALEEALARLPAEQREVMHLKLWEKMTFAQIGKVLKIPANTAASRYRYAIDKMQVLLRPLYEEIQ